LGQFFEHVRYTNPFDVNRVVQSSLGEVDVEKVHHAQFAQLVDLARRAHAQAVGIGAALWGEAGVGKSHLLARLGRWAGPDHRQAVFVYLANLQADAEHLPRSLLRYVVSILTRGRASQFHETPLYRVVNAAIRHALQDDGSQCYSFQEAQAAYERLIDELCDGGPAQAAVVDRPTYMVLLKFFFSAYLARQGREDGQAALAVRWLGGDYLDPEEAKSLGLARGPHRHDAVGLIDDQQIKNVLVALAQIASYRHEPLLLCFDQVDNLEREQCSALARFLHALLDSAGNLLVITAGLQETIHRWLTDGVIQETSYHRLAQHQIVPQRIGVREACQIVQARLRPYQQPFLSLPPVEDLVQKDYLFPLGESWSEEFLGGKIDVRPRDVINWAREGWRREQETLKELGGPAWLETWDMRKPSPLPLPLPTAEEIQRLIDEKIGLKLQEHKRQRELEPQTLPPDADNLAGLLHTLLQRCGDAPLPSFVSVQRLPRPKYGTPPPYHLVLRQRDADGDEVSTGLLCLVVSNRKSMAASLRRLVQDAQPPKRVFLVTDERRPLDPATAGKEYLEQLRARSGTLFRHVALTFAQYAELDALQAVVGLARSGDLEIELPGGQARRVSETEVIESHHRRQRYQAHPLLCQLLAEQGSVAEPPAAEGTDVENGSVSDDDLRQFIVDRLAGTRGASSNELMVQYHRHLEQVRQVRCELPACKSRLEEVAKQLHSEGQVIATPHDDCLFLTPRPSQPMAVAEADPKIGTVTESPVTPPPLEVSPDGELWVGHMDDKEIPVVLPCSALPTHVAVVGAAGSGKTWLAKVLAEEVLGQRVPVLAVDPQGDLVQFLKRRSPDPFDGHDRQSCDRFWRLVEPRIWTPGSSHGIRLCLNPIRLPSPEDLADTPGSQRRREELEGLLSTIAGNLVSLAKAGGDADCQRTFLFQILQHLTSNSKSAVLSLEDVAAAVDQPGTAGIEDPDRFIKKSERDKVARKLNALLFGPTANLFTGGHPLDLEGLLRPSEPGKVPLNVLYLNALPDDDQKQFFVAALAAEIYRWMVTTGSSSASPQLLFYLDEARDYIPAGVRKPVAKDALKRLFAQGRKYGVACLFCTQSPRSVDYEVFGNCSTKIIGRLESTQDVERVAEWFTKEGAAPAWLEERIGAAAGTFVARWPGMPAELEGRTWESRALFSLHEGAWSPERVEREMRDHPLRRG
ncbi:MAG TPA: DUF87 domain-containing protein, partial [Gemmataceae bacterium]|nr:DUF87 domain-containing protein [Gemmataceae bacterium]